MHQPEMWHVRVELDGLAIGDADDFARAHKRYGSFGLGPDSDRRRTWVTFLVEEGHLGASRAIKKAESIGALVGITGGASRVTFTTDKRQAEENQWPNYIGVTEAAAIIGVSRQRVAQLADGDPGFPQDGLTLPSGRVWPKASIDAYARNRSPRAGGRPRKKDSG